MSNQKKDGKEKKSGKEELKETKEHF